MEGDEVLNIFISVGEHKVPPLNHDFFFHDNWAKWREADSKLIGKRKTNTSSHYPAYGYDK